MTGFWCVSTSFAWETLKLFCLYSNRCCIKRCSSKFSKTNRKSISSGVWTTKSSQLFSKNSHLQYYQKRKSKTGVFPVILRSSSEHLRATASKNTHYINPSKSYTVSFSSVSIQSGSMHPFGPFEASNLIWNPFEWISGQSVTRKTDLKPIPFWPEIKLIKWYFV